MRSDAGFSGVQGENEMRTVLTTTLLLFLFGCASKDAIGAAIQPQDLVIDAMTARSILGDDYRQLIGDTRSSYGHRPVRVRSIEAYLAQSADDDEAANRRRAALVNAAMSASDLHCARYFERTSRTDSTASSILGTFSIASAAVATAARASQNAWAAGAVGFSSTRDLLRSEWLSDQSTSLIFRTVILERQRISEQIQPSKSFYENMGHVYRYHSACSVEAALTAIESAVEGRSSADRMDNFTSELRSFQDRLQQLESSEEEPGNPGSDEDRPTTE